MYIFQLEGVSVDVEVSDHASDILAVEVVLGTVDVSDAPVGVVIAVSTGTEWTISPQWSSFPVVIVMA